MTRDDKIIAIQSYIRTLVRCAYNAEVAAVSDSIKYTQLMTELFTQCAIDAFRHFDELAYADFQTVAGVEVLRAHQEAVNA